MCVEAAVCYAMGDDAVYFDDDVGYVIYPSNDVADSFKILHLIAEIALDALIELSPSR